ncbi:hypothetical protein [Pseudarthrobacter sulfonivorans]|uniref:hypothetical protein n=1 Tax=Pseudarthrobacter sulfonivorans TaxID=121292 RepID=UPI00285426C5|nr:hypothetical protein [Pseudarthrobacter sulfonivorans]MDR6413350.1 hypothetical protein [Pseudarthrobacter sulfonivorans]
MSVTMEAVLKVLEPDEPNYARAASLGSDALPHLRTLVEGNDPMLAAKAAYAASLLEGDQGKDIVEAAAHSETASVRVAAAAAANNLPADSAAEVLMDLVDDSDEGVRKVALSSVPADAPPELSAKVDSQGGRREDAGGTGFDEAPAREGAGAGTGAGSGMPGAGQSTMPGEKPATGLMPGEKPSSSNGRQRGDGLMPGEKR